MHIVIVDDDSYHPQPPPDLPNDDADDEHSSSSSSDQQPIQEQQNSVSLSGQNQLTLENTDDSVQLDLSWERFQRNLSNLEETAARTLQQFSILIVLCHS